MRKLIASLGIAATTLTGGVVFAQSAEARDVLRCQTAMIKPYSISSRLVRGSAATWCPAHRASNGAHITEHSTHTIIQFRTGPFWKRRWYGIPPSSLASKKGGGTVRARATIDCGRTRDVVMRTWVTVTVRAVGTDVPVYQYSNKTRGRKIHCGRS